MIIGTAITNPIRVPGRNDSPTKYESITSSNASNEVRAISRNVDQPTTRHINNVTIGLFKGVQSGGSVGNDYYFIPIIEPMVLRMMCMSRRQDQFST